LQPIFEQLLDLLEPDEEGHGWTAKTKPEESAISGYEFDFLVIATGRQVNDRLALHDFC
jgi:cation diffusion facilitator CzcD-associated flavoprotein CzcO